MLRPTPLFRVVCPVVALLTVLAASATRLESQATPRSRTVIALPDRFPNIDARALIVREPGLDVVLLRPEDATTDALTVALLTLHDLGPRRAGGGSGEMIPIVGYEVTNPPRRERVAALERALDRLRAAETTTLGSFGSARWIPLARR